MAFQSIASCHSDGFHMDALINKFTIEYNLLDAFIFVLLKIQ